MFKQFVAATACATMIAGCNTMRSPVVAVDQKARTNLSLIQMSYNRDDKGKVLTPEISALPDNVKISRGFILDREEKIFKTCIGDPSIDRAAEFAPVLALIFGIVVEKSIGFVLDKVEKNIAKVIEEHSATYGAAVSSNGFYKNDVLQAVKQDDPQVGKQTTLSYSCFRFTRYGGEKNKAPTMDVIGEWRASPDGGALEVRVLRVFYREKVAERGSKFGVSIGLKANATWQEGNVGKQADVFDIPIYSGKFDFEKEDQKFFVYPSHDASGVLKDFEESATQLPLPSWSKPKPTTSTYGNVKISVSVAEVAVPPKWLTTFQSLFKDNKDKIKGVLQAAANEALGINQGDQKK